MSTTTHPLTEHKLLGLRALADDIDQPGDLAHWTDRLQDLRLERRNANDRQTTSMTTPPTRKETA